MAYLKCGFITVYCSLILWKLNSSCQPAVLGAYNAKYLCLPQLFSCSKVVWASKVLHTVFLKNKCFLFLFGGTALLHMSMLRIRRVRVQTSCTLEKNCTTQLSHSTVECSFLNLPWSLHLTSHDVCGSVVCSSFLHTMQCPSGIKEGILFPHLTPIFSSVFAMLIRGKQTNHNSPSTRTVARSHAIEHLNSTVLLRFLSLSYENLFYQP